MTNQSGQWLMRICDLLFEGWAGRKSLYRTKRSQCTMMVRSQATLAFLFCSQVRAVDSWTRREWSQYMRLQLVGPTGVPKVVMVCFIFFNFWLHCYGIFIPWPGIEHVAPAVEARSLKSHDADGFRYYHLTLDFDHNSLLTLKLISLKIRLLR